jgi:hypothetical protein
MGVFRFYKGFDINSQPIQMMIGTNSEAFVVGEILKLSSGVLTKADVDTDGTQQYICLAAVTGATGVANVPVIQLRKSMQLEASSSGQIAASAIGSAYTLSTAATGVTTTTTKGCFVVDKTDGATTSTVVGHFLSAAAV